jgi:tRNA pseudouridine38-40 synthase
LTAALVGTHDFTAFTPTQTEHVRFERNVISAQWRAALENGRAASPVAGRSPGDAAPPEAAGLMELWIEADAFMRQMNRALVGTMLEVASGRRTFEDFERLLTGRPRSEAGPTAPAHGLALAAVSYPAGADRPGSPVSAPERTWTLPSAPERSRALPRERS